MTTFAIALLFVQDALQKPVTFESKAARISNVIPALAGASNEQLAFSPQMANEILVVSVKAMPLQTLLDKIAAVTSGEWKREGEQLRLQPSSVARNRESQEETAARLSSVRKAVADRVKQQTAAASKPDEPAMFVGIEERVITGLLKGIDITPIAMLNGGERVVFSSNPNSMQRRLGADAPALINKLVADHNATVAKQGPADNDELDKMPDFIKKMVQKRMQKIDGVQKALLIVSKPGFGMFDMTSVELRLYDAKGEVAFSGNSSLSAFDFAAMAAEATGAGSSTSKKATEISYSPESKALLAAFQGATMGGGMLRIEPKLLERLRRPDLYDPLSYMASDELFTFARAKGKALVANVPDVLMGSINTLVPGGKQTLEDFEADLKKGEDVSLSETESWIVIKPAKPIEARTHRTDRVALAALMKTAAEKGVPSLDDIAAYALTSPPPMEDGIGMLFGMTLVPGLFQQGLDGMTNWEALRFYGTLSVTQKQAAKQGGALQVGYMTPAQQAMWRKIVFGTSAQIRVSEPKEDEMPFSFAMGMMGGNTSSYRQEPTELMPNGLPPAATVTFGTSNQPMARMAGDGTGSTMAYFGVMGPDELALMKMFKDDPNMSAISGYMPSLDRLKVGERTIIKMTLQLPEQAFLRETLYDNRMPANAQVVSMANLPEPFQKLIAERAEALKKSPFGALGTMMGAMGRGPIKP